MARVVRDWTKWIVPRVNDNTAPNGNYGDKSFQTTDMISIWSANEMKRLPQEERAKSLTDFAIMNYGYINGVFGKVENGKLPGSFFLRFSNSGVGVESVEIAKERIAFRVKNGGHGIPDADVERRYVESFKNLKQIMKKYKLVVLYDNTEVFNRFAIYKDGNLAVISEDVPKWYNRIEE